MEAIRTVDGPGESIIDSWRLLRSMAKSGRMFNYMSLVEAQHKQDPTRRNSLENSRRNNSP